MLDEIFARYQQISDITRQDWDAVIVGMNKRKLEKGEIFIRPEDPSHTFALVLEGVSRHYYVGNDGKEWTKAFTGAGELMGVYAEMLQKRLSRTFIEAVTPMLIMQGGARELKLMEAPAWGKLWRTLAEEHFIKKENREYEFLKYDAAQRYQAYMTTYAHLDSKIPRKHVASYLGITPQALSRMGNEKSDR